MSLSVTTKAPPQGRKSAAPIPLEPERISPAPETIMPESETAMPHRNARIREIAYFLWLDEGCPDGQADRHWQAAEARLDADPLERKAIEGEPPGEPV